MSDRRDARRVPEAIDWHEGMLLAPQHFQQLSLRTEEMLHYHSAALVPFPWGVLRLAIDEAALTQGFLRVSEIEAVLPDGPVLVPGQPDELHRMLTNLASNAIKYTAAGGSITLGCTVRDDVVAVWVGDTGIGIAEEHLTRVFAPFVQIDRALNRPGEGTGLGLAISRVLARGMGGDITASSKVGGGTTFTLRLPHA